jgi:hypothetical protein
LRARNRADEHVGTWHADHMGTRHRFKHPCSSTPSEDAHKRHGMHIDEEYYRRFLCDERVFYRPCVRLQTIIRSSRPWYHISPSVRAPAMLASTPRTPVQCNNTEHADGQSSSPKGTLKVLAASLAHLDLVLDLGTYSQSVSHCCTFLLKANAPSPSPPSAEFSSDLTLSPSSAASSFLTCFLGRPLPLAAGAFFSFLAAGVFLVGDLGASDLLPSDLVLAEVGSRFLTASAAASSAAAASSSGLSSAALRFLVAFAAGLSPAAGAAAAVPV